MSTVTIEEPQYQITIEDNEDSVTVNEIVYQVAIENEINFINGAPLQYSGFQKITVGTTEPSSPSDGDLWVDTN